MGNISIYEIIFMFFIIYFITINVGYIILLILSYFSISKQLQKNKPQYWEKFSSSREIPISIIAPAYNEELTIVESVKSMLTLDYNEYEIVVVCDGPKDNTLNELIKNFNLTQTINTTRTILKHKEIEKTYISTIDRRLKVILKKNGGKADALNCGINVSQYPLFCAIDADSLLEKDSLGKLATPFMSDITTVATGGIVRIANGCDVNHGEITKVNMPRTLVEGIQVVEYLRAFFLGRMGWIPLDSLMIISGAFGLFSKDAVLKCGGYNTLTVGEDMDLVLRLRNYSMLNKVNFSIKFVPDAVCWTQCPDNYKTLKNQRSRWQRGLLECLWNYKHIFLNPKSGTVGVIAYPFFIFIEALGPIIEGAGYIFVLLATLFGFLNIETFIYLYMIALLLGIILSISSIYIEEEYFDHYNKTHIFKMISLSLFENLWFRYLHLYWRLKGTVQYFLKKGHWGEMKRKKFNS